MNECGCVFIDVDRPPDFINKKNPKARKLHHCGECGREISKGEKYFLEFGMWDGEFSQYKTCSDCGAIREAFFCDGWYYGRILDDLHEHISETNGEVPESCIVELPDGARNIVFGLIEDVWAE